MKMSLKWHKNCLSKRYNSIERKKEQLEKLQIEIKREVQEATFYHVQVVEAEHMGKDGFDPDLFMKKQKEFYVTD